MKEDIIYKYFANQTTEAENKVILDWIKASPENESTFFELKAIWFTCHELLNRENGTTKENSLKQINQRTGYCTPENKRFFLYKASYIGRGIAVILLIACISVFLTDHFKTSSTLTITNTFPDSIMQIKLNNGSLIWLNTGSTIFYSGDIKETKKIKLTGSAFLDIVKDPEHPFIVNTDYYQIKVLGTSFSVNTHKEYDTGEVVLTEGSVQLNKTNGNPILTLQPGQQALISNDYTSVLVNNIDTKQHTLWRFGITHLSNVSISEIINTLEETFSIKIQMEINHLSSHRYNFSFKQSSSPEEVLNDLYLLTNVQAIIIAQ